MPQITYRPDQRTYDFLQALRDQEGVNLDRWITEAIRAKAGLSPKPHTDHKKGD